MRGVIKRLVRNRGFGFLEGEDGVERFFHFSSVRTWVDIDNLAEDDQITFEEERSTKGPRAKNIDVFGVATPETAEANGNQAQANRMDSAEAEDRRRTPAHRRDKGKSFRASKRHMRDMP